MNNTKINKIYQAIHESICETFCIVNSNSINDLKNDHLKLINFYLNDFDKLKEIFTDVICENSIKINIIYYLSYLNDLYENLNIQNLEIKLLSKDKENYLNILEEQIHFYKMEKIKIKDEFNKLNDMKININLNNKYNNSLFETLQKENELNYLRIKNKELELKLENYNKNEEEINKTIFNFSIDNNDNINLKLNNLKKIIKLLLLEFKINKESENNKIIKKSFELINE